MGKINFPSVHKLLSKRATSRLHPKQVERSCLLILLANGVRAYANLLVSTACALVFFSSVSIAQTRENEGAFRANRVPDPFLFSVSTLTPDDMKWSIDYSGSYGERVQGPFGYNGVNQQVALKGYLGRKLTVYAFTAVGIAPNDKVSSAQQAELLHNIIGGKKALGIRLGTGLGVRRDYSNVKSLLFRVTLAHESLKWLTTSNLLFEKALASNRDKIDFITSLGVHYRFTDFFHGGVEALGEDLEGFWDKEEAEGGAKVLIGPTVNFAPRKSKLSFSLSGGPVIYATRNQVYNPDAIRELPSQSGLMIRAKVTFNLSGS